MSCVRRQLRCSIVDSSYKKRRAHSHVPYIHRNLLFFSSSFSCLPHSFIGLISNSAAVHCCYRRCHYLFSYTFYMIGAGDLGNFMTCMYGCAIWYYFCCSLLIRSRKRVYCRAILKVCALSCARLDIHLYIVLFSRFAFVSSWNHFYAQILHSSVGYSAHESLVKVTTHTIFTVRKHIKDLCRIETINNFRICTFTIEYGCGDSGHTPSSSISLSFSPCLSHAHILVGMISIGDAILSHPCFVFVFCFFCYR